MIEYIVLFAVIFVFLIASFEDIKKREVYDYINYSLAFFIITIAIFDSLINSNLDPLKYTGFGILIGFALGSALYYLGIWGGGDAKFLIGFSASIYYLKNFINKEESIYLIFNNLVNILSYLFELFMNSFLYYILIFDVIFLLILIVIMINTKDIEKLRPRFTLFTILFLLFIGLYFDYSNLILVSIGFASFLLIFFGDEDTFSSAYIKIKKKIKNLIQFDIPDSSIIQNGKTIVDYENSKEGLTKEHINQLDEKIKNKDEKINIRKIIPYSIIIALNYVIYIFKIVSLNQTNIEILGFLFKFLLISFFVGALIGIFLLIIFYFKNTKKIKLSFTKLEIYFFGIIFFSSLLFYILIQNQIVLFLITLIPIYILIKILRKIENQMFIKLKPMEKITYGDWIAQDIKIKDKLIYSIDDFKLGINEKQLDNLVELSKKHKELTKIYVKDGLAFLPPLFIGFIIAIII